MIAKARHVFRTTWRAFYHNVAMFFTQRGVVFRTTWRGFLKKKA